MKRIILLIFITLNLIYSFAHSQPFAGKMKKPIVFFDYIDGNTLNLKALDLTDAAIPQVLSFLAKRPDITALNLDENQQIDAAGVSLLAQNATLLSLSLEGDSIADEGVIALAKNTHLKSLNLIDSFITDDTAIALANNNTLTSLGVSAYNLGDKGINALAANPTLNSLTVRWITKTNVDKITSAFADNNTLTSLNLECDNSPPGFFGDAQAAIIAKNTHLKELILFSNNIGDVGAKALASNTTLTKLDLSYNANIDNAGAAELAHNSTLKYLDLSGDNINDDGATVLAHSHLTTLKLEGNHMYPGIHVGDKGAIELAKNTTIKFLDLDGQNIGTAGAIALANNKTLRTLSLFWVPNHVGSEQAIQAFANNQNLISLNIGLSTVDPGSVAAFATNSTLKTLGLDKCELNDNDASYLAKNNTITQLQLAGNNITSVGAISLANNTTLKFLDLSSNVIGSDGGIALAHNTTLKSLQLDNTFWQDGPNHLNLIGDEGVNAFAQNTTLAFLNLTKITMSQSALALLAANNSISCIRVSSNFNKNHFCVMPRACPHLLCYV